MAKEMRFYYLVAVLAAGGSLRSNFTYHSFTKLAVGQLVRLGLGRRTSLGVVVGSSAKPSFVTKPIDEIIPLPPIPSHLVELALWMSDYYATPLARVWQTVLPSNPFVKNPRVGKPTLDPPEDETPIKLVAQQTQAISQITKGNQLSYLLYGATGSGKTQVYLELAKLGLNSGRSTIILVPEISLTPQTAVYFERQFPGQVITTHSALTPAQRRALWQDALATSQPKIVIGPRSALFMPVAKLAYIAIDEAHDPSYKQDQAPRYQTAAVAAQLARLGKAKLVLGSATPSVGDVFLAGAGRLAMIRMPNPIFKARRRPPVIVDLKDKRQLSTSPFISRPLLEVLRSTLASGKQSILFLNRRGSARLALCRHCGWVAICPNCQIPLTWHADRGQLECHWCGYGSPPPGVCPDCGHPHIRFIGGGTKRIEADIGQLLPTARLARLDRDSFDGRTINQLYKRLQNGQIDILIGTQMITKGLDLPGVETVGIILADSMLYLPDFTAAERTFHLLYQVSGRAGRRDNSLSNIVIQTFSPNHPAIKTAATGDYESFIESELRERKALNYPPFVYLLKLSISRASRAAAQAAANQLAAKLKTHPKVLILGPAPAWRETMGGKYNWQIIAKAKDRDRLVKIANSLPAGWTHDLDPIDLL